MLIFYWNPSFLNSLQGYSCFKSTAWHSMVKKDTLLSQKCFNLSAWHSMDYKWHSKTQLRHSIALLCLTVPYCAFQSLSEMHSRDSSCSECDIFYWNPSFLNSLQGYSFKANKIGYFATYTKTQSHIHKRTVNFSQYAKKTNT